MRQPVMLRNDWGTIKAISSIGIYLLEWNYIWIIYGK